MTKNNLMKYFTIDELNVFVLLHVYYVYSSYMQKSDVSPKFVQDSKRFNRDVYTNVNGS